MRGNWRGRKKGRADPYGNSPPAARTSANAYARLPITLPANTNQPIELRGGVRSIQCCTKRPSPNAKAAIKNVSNHPGRAPTTVCATKNGISTHSAVTSRNFTAEPYHSAENRGRFTTSPSRDHRPAGELQIDARRSFVIRAAPDQACIDARSAARSILLILSMA